jgi:tetratricopeptide (TPR) repeat protein
MPESSFNLGNTTYQLGRHDEAARRFKELAETESLSQQQRSDAYYNLGNSLIKTQDFENAVEAYKNSLRLEPGDEDARHNLSMAMQMLQKQQQEQQQQQQNQDQNQQQDPNQQREGQQDENGDQGEEEQQQEGGEDQQPGDQQDNPQQGEGEGEPREMTQEEMERILRALEQDEKETQKKVNAQRAKTQRGDEEKDW